MKRITFFMSFVLMSVCTNAQFSISGNVTDINNKAIIGASIYLEGTSKGTITGVDGKFMLMGIPNRKYLLKVNCTGYNSYSKDVELISENISLNIRLNEDITQLEEVVVSSIKAQKNTPTTYNTIKKEDINDINLGQDAPYLMSLEPSVVVTSDAGTGIGYTGMRIRGTIQRILMLR